MLNLDLYSEAALHLAQQWVLKAVDVANRVRSQIRRRLPKAVTQSRGD